MRPVFTRHPLNPIVTAGQYEHRLAVTFNPGVIYDEGRFYMYERAAGGLRPFICAVGMLESDDGVHFTPRPEPVFTPAMCGSQYGSVQDPRVTRIGDTYYMTFAYRPFAWSSHPTAVGVPESHQTDFPGFDGDPRKNQTRSGIAVSRDRVNWQLHSWATSPEIDDRDVILFPEKVLGGKKWAILRRPLPYVEASHKAPMIGGIKISFSDDLRNWSEPETVIDPAFSWEPNRIGGATPPLRTPHGWLTLYHGVETVEARRKRVIYRLGGMLLDLDDPRKVVARCPDFLMEPETYYERFGAYIPNVIFPTANFVKDDLLWLYYGVCDTAIALATVPLADLVTHILRTGRR